MTGAFKLDVWLEAFDAPVGTLERHPDKSLIFTYAPGAAEAQRISLSMPVRAEPYTDALARAFFGNLLQEGRELERIQAAHGIDRDDIGGLLFHVGADCPGAISVTPEGTGPGKRPGLFPEDYLALGPEVLRGMVRFLHLEGRLPDGAPDPSPVAGVQPKIAVMAHEGAFYLPKAGSRAPTTHILKVSPAADPQLTRHEVALLTLAEERGLEVAGHEALSFAFPDLAASGAGGMVHAILSTRFDRRVEEIGPGRCRISRIHCEDLCQALGLERYLRYERNATEPDHRFSMAAVGALAGQVAAPGLFRLGFLRQTLFNLMVGNSDNHGKNASILYDQARGRAYGRLAPFYDVVPVMMDPKVTHQLAFDLGQAQFAEDLTLENLHSAMRDLGFRKPKLDGDLRKLLAGLAESGPGRLAELLPDPGGKILGDAVAAQMQVVIEALGLEIPVEARDHYPRYVRDEKPGSLRGGWDSFS